MLYTSVLVLTGFLDWLAGHSIINVLGNYSIINAQVEHDSRGVIRQRRNDDAVVLLACIVANITFVVLGRFSEFDQKLRRSRCEENNIWIVLQSHDLNQNYSFVLLIHNYLIIHYDLDVFQILNTIIERLRYFGPGN